MRTRLPRRRLIRPSDYFQPLLWEEAFKSAGVDRAFYMRRRGVEEILPWDFIDMGFPREALVGEFEKMQRLACRG